jgi:hypothetical protein
MTARTALVIRPITRCEFGTLSHGLMAEVFDRVSVTKTSDRTSNGTRFHTCVTDSGETFQAIDTMVQLDG